MPDQNHPNEHGIPLHACNGYRCDEHVWLRLRVRILRGEFGERPRDEAVKTWGPT